LENAMNSEKQLTAEQLELLNKICELMKSIDAENLSKLQDIYNNTPEIQISKTFKTVSTNSDNSTAAKNN